MDSWWPLLLVIGAVALLLGPIMVLQPSSRQRQLAQLRQAALKRGISVRLDSSNKKAPPIAVYSLAWPISVKTGPFYLKKQDVAHDLHLLDYWYWEGDGCAPDSWLPPLTAILRLLPEDIVGIECTKHSLGLFWLEKRNQTTLDAVEDLLKKSQAILLDAIMGSGGLVNMTSEPKN